LKELDRRKIESMKEGETRSCDGRKRKRRRKRGEKRDFNLEERSTFSLVCE
jgi:hypothetical protein